MPEDLRHLGPWAMRDEPWPEAGATCPCAVRRRHGEPLKVRRIAFRALGRKGVHRDHAYPVLGPRGEQETAALRILATSRHVPGAGGVVTVAVPLMTAPPAAGPAGPAELGRRSAGRRGWQPRSAPCSASAHRLSTGACACLGPLAGPWSATSMTLPFPLARVIAVLTLVPGRTSQMADLDEDRPGNRH